MKGSEFLNKLVNLLGEAVPQAVNYLILASSGEIVAELRTKKKCGDEDVCLHKLQADLKAYPRSFPSAHSSMSGLSYYAFPSGPTRIHSNTFLYVPGGSAILIKSIQHTS